MPHSYGLNASKVIKRCVTIEEYRKFFNTAHQVFTGKHSNTLQTRRCAMRNCKKYTWSGHRTWNMEFSRIFKKPSHEVSPFSNLRLSDDKSSLPFRSQSHQNIAWSLWNHSLGTLEDIWVFSLDPASFPS